MIHMMGVGRPLAPVQSGRSDEWTRVQALGQYLPLDQDTGQLHSSVVKWAASMQALVDRKGSRGSWVLVHQVPASASDWPRTLEMRDRWVVLHSLLHPQETSCWMLARDAVCCHHHTQPGPRVVVVLHGA
jgi:hypothetical protein